MHVIPMKADRMKQAALLAVVPVLVIAGYATSQPAEASCTASISAVRKWRRPSIFAILARSATVITDDCTPAIAEALARARKPSR